MEQQIYSLSKQEPSTVVALSQNDIILWFSGTPLNISYQLAENFPQHNVLNDRGTFVAPICGEYTLKIDVELSCSDQDIGVAVIKPASDIHVTLDDITVNVGDIVVDMSSICTPIVFQDICAKVNGRDMFVTPVRKGETVTYYYPTGELIEGEVVIDESLNDCNCN